ncbi:MOSC domain-containing protein [Roseobacter sinensis]|uniref:MOSC domain-containing protein n=1 Tax=Roseobacter sinensis TaxID=2931391 RepID=A0ABT3BJF5_9RHOB|nr:MOSC N-terminal beta barrel domain-containing protein [Roseobacter sp. WL0113]MCV3273707.1 MOSC domain-containing protein [Roseobacter sp. WL0113]
MTATLRHIWRHPLKGLGSEAVETVDLDPTQAVVGDRLWALLNAEADDTDEWQPRRNFLQVASGPRLAALTAESTRSGIRLTHPDRDPIEIDPASDGQALGAWIGDLWPDNRPGPARLVKAPVQGMTDVEYPSVSLGNLASLRALSQKAGFEIDMRRFRINLWLDGLAPWEEIDLLQRDITLGSATLSPVEPIERCRAPDANPASGSRDIGMLRLLEDGWDTRNFGVYFKVTVAGSARVGDRLG